MMAMRSRPRVGLSLLALVGFLTASALPGSAKALTTPGPTPGAIGLVCTIGPTFHLQATDGYISNPDGNSLYMWSYAPASGSFQSPGPTLCVNQDDTVTITLENNLSDPPGPATADKVSMVFPGQSSVAASGGSPGLFTREAPPGGSVSYTFTASEPGTYLYESGTEPSKQVQMGLYGALIVYPTGTGFSGGGYAYNHAASAYDSTREYLLVISEIDPELHAAVEQGLDYDVTLFHPDYWTVNGRSFPDTIADNGVPWLPNQPYGALVQVEASADPGATPALVRYANAGMANHPFHPHGNHLRVIARDGRLLRGPADEDASFEDFTRTIGSGQTYDLLFRWTNVEPWNTGADPVPVTIPGLQNLVFKDGATFYSGDPRLGQQGEFPVGVVSYSECGEYYFPWHSHALFEFTNFTEGFGGLATILRVDPPGGC